MPSVASIEIGDSDALEAALNDIGLLHDIVHTGKPTNVQSTVAAQNWSRMIIQDGSRQTSMFGTVGATTGSFMSYPVPFGKFHLVPTLSNSALPLQYCTHLQVVDCGFGHHAQSDWYARLNSILVSLGRLQPGWWGAGSLAPRISACRDLERVGFYLPAHAKQPDVEVDESTGSVSLIWSQHSPSTSVTLVFTGDGSVIGIVIGHSFRARWKHPVSNDQAILNALSVATARVVLLG